MRRFAWDELLGHLTAGVGCGILAGATAVVLVALVIVLALGGCAPAPEVPQAVPTAEGATPEAAATPAEPTPVSSGEVRRTFVVMGIDRAPWREGDGRRPHSDYFMVVSLAVPEPAPAGTRVAVTIIQVPRNLYMPVEGIADDFVFGVYAQGGIPLIKWWVQEALGLPVDGVAAVRMDEFAEIIDRLGGVDLQFEGQAMSGMEALEFVRFDLWGSTYDPERRHLRMLMALSETLRDRFRENAFQTAVVLWDLFAGTVETDILPGPFLSTAIRFGPYWEQGDYDVRLVQMDGVDSILYRGDIPFETAGTTRGLMVRPGEDLQTWIAERLLRAGDE